MIGPRLLVTLTALGFLTGACALPSDGPRPPPPSAAARASAGTAPSVSPPDEQPSAAGDVAAQKRSVGPPPPEAVSRLKLDPFYKKYGTIDPGRRMNQSTYVGHLWLTTQGDGTPLRPCSRE